MVGSRPRMRAARAFTLIELLVVIGIIVIIVAILIPTLAGARNAARAAATRALLTDLGNASAQFEQDHRQLPGHFSATVMADAANETRGFSNMENIMLDLGGGIDSTGAPDNTATFAVGPTATDTVVVDVTKIGGAIESSQGVTARGYFTPDKRYFVAQSSSGAQESNVPGHIALPDIIDADGNPVLAWVRNGFADPEYAAGDTRAFAEIDSGGFPGDKPYYYWVSNSAFLSATATGDDVVNQAEMSLIGADESDANRQQSLAGLLGNPAYPDPLDPALPRAGRGGLVFHSAGTNGVFLGREERGGKVAAGDGGFVRYNAGEDVMRRFDDILSVAGN